MKDDRDIPEIRDRTAGAPIAEPLPLLSPEARTGHTAVIDTPGV